MRRRSMKILACLSAAALLGGCVKPESKEPRAETTLAPASVVWAAPDGDEILRRTEERMLYLADYGELHLRAEPVTVEAEGLNTLAENLVRLQLEEQGRRVSSLPGDGRALTLYGASPVEISGGICTVNLGTSALQMTYRDLYRSCIALATTLCDLDEISFVNVLAANQSIGMDITGSLAMGSLTGHPDENLPVLWEQMEARRTPLGDDLSRTPLSAMATVYYPLEEARGIECEARILNFDGQTPQQLAAGLLQALEQVMRENGGSSIPSLSGLMLHEPLTSELEDGGRLITLSLAEDAREKLEAAHLDLTCVLAAVTCTLTTFIPGIAAVCVRIGDRPLTELAGAGEGTIPVLGGLLRRETFAGFLRGSATVYLAEGERLRACEHPVGRNEADEPRAMLKALLDGPSRREAEAGLRGTVPAGVQEDDILGIAVEGETVLVNLSESFRAEIQAAGTESEMLLCYSMVNTLCTGTGCRRVCFFFEGEQVEQIAGSLYWAGTFTMNPGLLAGRPGLFILRSYFCQKRGLY